MASLPVAPDVVERKGLYLGRLLQSLMLLCGPEVEQVGLTQVSDEPVSS